MPVTLNHSLVNVRDKRRSARFLAEIIGLPTPPFLLGTIFAVVQVGATSLNFIDSDEAIEPQHHAFLVTEPEFDQILARIRDRGLSYWADPARRQAGEINHWNDGRGVYFPDPDGHLLEIITRPYGYASHTKIRTGSGLAVQGAFSPARARRPAAGRSSPQA